MSASGGAGSSVSIGNHRAEGSAEREMDSANGNEVSSTAKNKRYDRQIRIWGAHGQQRLEKCKVCLLNCGATGAEALKNLVLGGIASFTIVDAQKVSDKDIGNNFMVDASSLGEPRAKVVTALVQELNESVAGSYLEESPESLIERNPQFFAQFTVVIATQMHEAQAIKLDDICREHRVLLVLVRSYGLMGLLRPSIPEHTVVESKPDNIVDDLRIHQPFPELQQFAHSFNLSTVDEITLHHIPYAVLLIRAADAWRESHGGSAPSNSKQRSDFKQSLYDMRRVVGDVPVESENFDEAVKAAFHAWTPYRIPSEVQALLADESCADASLGPNTSPFWVIMAALRRFVEQEGGGTFLPLEGAIPDMHATTELYLKLQRVYRERAERDVAAVEAHVASILSSTGRSPSAISRDTIRLYCKDARNLRLVRYRSLAQEYASSSAGSGASSGSAHAGGAGGGGGSSSRGEVLASALSTEGTAACASLYLLLRAVDRFYTTHGRYPGAAPGSDTEEDLPGLKLCAMQLQAECGAGSVTIQDDYVLEMVRFGAGELHVVASFMGGMAAQEVIKLVTGQFTPLSGALVYNGMGGTTASLEL